jgi:hypothetical protein
VTKEDTLSELEIVNALAAIASIGSFLFVVYGLVAQREWKQVAAVTVFALLLGSTVYLSTELFRERQIEYEAARMVKTLPSSTSIIFSDSGSNCSLVAGVVGLMDKYHLESNILRSRSKVCEKELTGNVPSDSTYKDQTKEVALLAAGLVRLWAKEPER